VEAGSSGKEVGGGPGFLELEESGSEGARRLRECNSQRAGDLWEFTKTGKDTEGPNCP